MASQLIPLSFEKGLDEAQEDSVLPEGSASVLQNWIPEPTGGLRCRRGWLNAATTSAPGTRKTRSIGFFKIVASIETPAQVQKAQNITSTATTAVSWPATTTTGNLLVLVIGALGSTAPSVPGGWTQVSSGSTGGGAPNKCYIYTKENAASESGSVSVTVTGATAVSVQIAEYSGVERSSSLDKVANTSGTSTTPASGTTAATTQNQELWIAGLLDLRNEAQSAPTNSFSIAQQQGAAGITAGMLERVVTGTGTASTAVTTATSDTWAGCIATFKARNIAAANYVVAAHDATTGYTLYYHDASDLTTGAWAAIETITTSVTSYPVSFAQGLGNVLYSNRKFSTIRKWDGTTAGSIAGSPPGRTLSFHKNRFFAGGTEVNPTRLWYSDLASYSTWSAISYIDVGKDDGEAIVDAVVFEENLLIAKENSLWFLSGSGPEDFTVHPLNAGSAYTGRCIAVTPFGAVIAGQRQVWLWTGGGVQDISPPISESYSLTGDFVSTAYVDGVTYITDEATGTTFCLDMQRGTWWTETTTSPTTEGLACIATKNGVLYYGPQAATTISLVAYRSIPGTSRARDASLAETFLAYTPEIWVGPDKSQTPRHLYLKLRQRGGNAAQTGLTITPYYDGTAETALTWTPQASAGVYRVGLGVGPKRGVNYVQFRFSQTVLSFEASLIDIEEALLEVDSLERRASG